MALMNLLLTLSAINGYLLLPILFNFKIIPNIEKKTGCRLEYTLISYNLLPFRSYLARYLEISLYIITKYFNIPKEMNPEFALVKINYQRRLFSKIEIIWSIISIINMICFFVLLGLFAFLSKADHFSSIDAKSTQYYEKQNINSVNTILNENPYNKNSVSNIISSDTNNL